MSDFSPIQTLHDLCVEINISSPMQNLMSCTNNQDFDKIKRHAYNVSELRPSGPRQKDTGIEQTQQGIMHAQLATDGSVVLKVTLLAAGFVVGGKGQNIQKVCERSRARSKSWFQEVEGCGTLRVFYIEGRPQAVLHAVQIVIQAINRYKELIQGKYQDQVVSETQMVEGISFQYKPPPIHTIPVAARTKHFSGAPPSVYGAQKVAKMQSQKQVSESSEDSGSISKDSDVQVACENSDSRTHQSHIQIAKAEGEWNSPPNFHQTQADQNYDSYTYNSYFQSPFYSDPMTYSQTSYYVPLPTPQFVTQPYPYPVAYAPSTYPYINYHIQQPYMQPYNTTDYHVHTYDASLMMDRQISYASSSYLGSNSP